MPGFNRRPGGGDHGGSRPYRKPFGARPSHGATFGGGRRDDDAPRPMHTATCAKCKNECQVPFRPNGTKPVFCNNCFQRDDKPRFEQSERPAYVSRPHFDKPAFASAPARAATPGPSTQDFEKLKIQIDILHNKIDRILKLVSPVVTIEPVEDEKPTKKSKAKKK